MSVAGQRRTCRKRGTKGDMEETNEEGTSRSRNVGSEEGRREMPKSARLFLAVS